jgi:hypothetical protein
VLGVVAGGTLRIQVDLPGVAYTLTAVNYNAARNGDGTGGDIANLVPAIERVTASTIAIVFYNPNAFDAFLVGNSTSPTPGDPAIALLGRCIRPGTESGYQAIRDDTGSASRYGSQSLDVPANVFRQSGAAANDLAAYLLDALREPHPTLSGVEIVGDPRLQLTDRVRVVEAEGLAVDGEFWLTAIQTTLSRSAGLAQSVTLRQA